jgi:hypothetical protein
MDVLSAEQGIQLSFVKTSEFGGGAVNPLIPPLSMPLICNYLPNHILMHPRMPLNKVHPHDYSVEYQISEL